MGATNTELTFRQNDEDLKSEILNEISKKENVLSEKDIMKKKVEKSSGFSIFVLLFSLIK